jgi:hypothetical protein
MNAESHTLPSGDVMKAKKTREQAGQASSMNAGYGYASDTSMPGGSRAMSGEEADEVSREIGLQEESASDEPGGQRLRDARGNGRCERIR